MERTPLNESSNHTSYSKGSPKGQQFNANVSPSHEELDARFSCNICLDPVRDPVVTQCGHLYCWPCLFRWLRSHHQTCPVCKAGVSQENVIPLFIRGSEHDPRMNNSNISPSPSLSPLAGQMNSMTPSQLPMPGTDVEGGVPNRPPPRRPEVLNVFPETQTGGMGMGVGVGAGSLSTSYGFFPSLFGLQFQSFPPFLQPLPASTTHPSPDPLPTQIPPPNPSFFFFLSSSPSPSPPLSEEESHQKYLTNLLYLLATVVGLCLVFF